MLEATLSTENYKVSKLNHSDRATNITSIAVISHL